MYTNNVGQTQILSQESGNQTKLDKAVSLFLTGYWTDFFGFVLVQAFSSSMPMLRALWNSFFQSKLSGLRGALPGADISASQ